MAILQSIKNIGKSILQRIGVDSEKPKTEKSMVFPITQQGLPVIKKQIELQRQENIKKTLPTPQQSKTPMVFPLTQTGKQVVNKQISFQQKEDLRQKPTIEKITDALKENLSGISSLTGQQGPKQTFQEKNKMFAQVLKSANAGVKIEPKILAEAKQFRDEFIQNTALAGFTSDLPGKIGKTVLPKLFRGDMKPGQVIEVKNTFKKILEGGTNQKELISKWAAEGDKKAEEILKQGKTQYDNAFDRYIDQKAAVEGFDAVKYTNADRPQFGQEFRDVIKKASYSENKDTALAHSFGRSPKRAVELGVEDISKLPKVERSVIQEFPEMGSADKLAEIRSHTRGVIGDEEALATAKTLGITKEDVLRKPIGTILNKEEKLAVSGVVRNSLDELKAAETQLPTWKAALESEDQAVKNAAEISMQNFAKKKVETMKLLAVERGVAAETGRALQAHKVIADAISDGDAILAKYLSKSDTPQEAKDFIYKKIEDFAGEPEEMAALLRKLHQSTAMEKFVEFATAIKLTAIPTHLVNMLSTATRVLTDIPLRGLSGAFDKTLGKLYGGSRERFAKEMTAEAQGQWLGFKTGWGNVLNALKDENFATKSKQLSDIQFKGHAIKGRLGKEAAYDKFLDFLGPKIRVPFRLLGVEDLIFRRPAEMGSLFSEATRNALKKGLSPKTKAYDEFVANFIHDPSALALDIAEKKADTSLFQAELPSGLLKDLNTVRNNNPSIKLIVPFFNGVANVIKQGLEFTPIAPIFKTVRTDLRKRGPAMDALAKMTLGTAAMYPFFQYAIEDKITLGAPKDEKGRQRWADQGKTPYSIKVGENWVPYARFSPFADWVTYAAMMAEATKKGDDKKFQDILTDAFFGISSNVLDKSFVLGLSDALNALTDPEGGKAKKFVQNLLTGSTIPAMVSRATQSKDPIVRETNSIKEAYMSKIPFISEKLIAKKNRFGEDVVRPGSAVTRFLSPSTPSPIKVNLVSDEIADLDIDFGFPAQTAFGGKMDKKDYDILKEVSGKTVFSVVSDIIQTPEYQNLSSQKKKALIEKIITKTRDSTRKAVAPDLYLISRIRDRIKSKKPNLSEAQIQSAAEEVFLNMKEGEKE